jgi:hypothetical protein
VDASVTKFFAQLKKLSPPVKSPKMHEAKLMMMKSLQMPTKHAQSNYNHTLVNKECTKKSDKILGETDEEAKISQFPESVGITRGKLDDESKVEKGPTCLMWVAGQPMAQDIKFPNATQTRKFHKLYMDQSKAGINMFRFQYKNNHFLSGDGEQCILWDEMYRLPQGNALGAQLICLWEL